MSISLMLKVLTIACQHAASMQRMLGWLVAMNMNEPINLLEMASNLQRWPPT